MSSCPLSGTCPSHCHAQIPFKAISPSQSPPRPLPNPMPMLSCLLPIPGSYTLPCPWLPYSLGSCTLQGPCPFQAPISSQAPVELSPPIPRLASAPSQDLAPSQPPSPSMVPDIILITGPCLHHYNHCPLPSPSPQALVELSHPLLLPPLPGSLFPSILLSPSISLLLRCPCPLLVSWPFTC